MDTDSLRLILAGCGVVLVGGIYLRERLRLRGERDSDGPDSVDEDPDEHVISLKPGKKGPDEEIELPSLRTDSFEPVFPDSTAPDPEPRRETAAERHAGDGDAEDPFGIVQIKVTAHEGMCFSGTLLIDALSAAGLEFGAMNIFHRQPDKSQLPLFSVVNMVEPGTFPVDNPGQFESPGVVFFLQVAVSDRPLLAFDEMIRTAQILAARIGGEIRDQENQLLTVEKTEAIREGLAPVAG